MRSAVLCGLMVWAGSAAAAQGTAAPVRQVMSGRCQPLTSAPVSLIQLIANPERFDRKCVEVMGYLHLEFEGDAIYLGQADYEHGITRNALWVDASDVRLFDGSVNDTMAIIDGEFRAHNHGHLGAFSGTLMAITRVDPSSSRRRAPPAAAAPAR